MLLKLGMIGSIAGCILVAADHALWANVVWVLFNPCMLIHNLKIKEYYQASLWCLYVLIALGGIIFHYAH